MGKVAAVSLQEHSPSWTQENDASAKGTSPDFDLPGLLSVTSSDFDLLGLLSVTSPDFDLPSLLSVTSPDFYLPDLLSVLHQQSTLRLCRLPLHAVLENTLRHPGHAVLLVLPLSLRWCPETYSLNAKSI